MTEPRQFADYGRTLTNSAARTWASSPHSRCFDSASRSARSNERNGPYTTNSENDSTTTTHTVPTSYRSMTAAPTGGRGSRLIDGRDDA